MDAPRADRGITKEKLSERLRAAGLKATQPRLLVLGLLDELGGHLSADDLVAELRARGMPHTRASVYNVLAALLTHGLLMLTDVGPGKALYEPSDRWHHHFVCRSCGAIRDIPCVTGEKPCLTPEAFDGKVDEAQVIFRGLCGDCVRRTKGRKGTKRKDA